MISIPAESVFSFLENVYFCERTIGPGQEGHLRNTASMLGRFLGREALLSDLNAVTLNAFLRSLEGTRRPSTLAGRRGCVVAIVQAAIDAGLIADFPVRRIRSYRKSAVVPQAWTPDDVKKLLEAARSLHGCHKGVERSKWWCAYIRTAYETGLRPVDLHLLTNASISSAGVIAIEQHKTGKAILRRVSQTTLRLIRELRRPERIFGGWLGKDQRRTWFAKIVQKAGLTGTFYRLRSTCGTLVDRQHPGQGHIALGNGRAVFEKHYLAKNVDLGAILMPPEV